MARSPEKLGEHVESGVLVQIVEGDVGVKVAGSVPGEAFQGQPQHLDAEGAGIGVGIVEGVEGVADSLACRGQSGGLVEEKALRLPEEQAERRRQVEQEACRQAARLVRGGRQAQFVQKESDAIGVAGGPERDGGDHVGG